MAIILNPEIENNTFFSEKFEEDIDSVYIVIDQAFMDKKSVSSAIRLQVDYYKSKALRQKGLGLIDTQNIYPSDITSFLGDNNFYTVAYTYVMEKLNCETDKYIAG